MPPALLCYNTFMAFDSASAYEKHAREFLSARDSSTIGVDVIDRWARSLQRGVEVLEIGCGGGLPVTRVLADAGLKVSAIDSSPTLLCEFRSRFPSIPVECTNVLQSNYFGKQFEAAIAVGVIFLLKEDDQAELIHQVSEHIFEGGSFLFTAPLEVHTWTDVLARNKCESLGCRRYESILNEAGFRLVATYNDSGGNNYYEAERVLSE